MLHIYFKNVQDIRKIAESHKLLVDGLELIWNVEEAFSNVKLTGSDVERQIIADIEEGEYINNSSFKNRHGITLSRLYLSTGCKAVLVAIHNPNKIISTLECGKNALGAIITYCKEGHIIMYNDSFRIPYPNAKFIEEIDVECEGHRFTKFTDFNDYIDNR